MRITYGSRVVTTVAGAAASRLAEALVRADDREVQHLLAPATGNFKRGNERPGRG